LKPYQHPKEARLSPSTPVTTADLLTPITAKPGQKTLSELDEYRYVEAINTFTPTSKSPMTPDAVKLLVEWKLSVPPHPLLHTI
jgi:hypothetical protein